MACEPRAWGRDAPSLGAGQGWQCLGLAHACVPFPPYGLLGPSILAFSEYQSHSLWTAAHSCFPAQLMPLTSACPPTTTDAVTTMAICRGFTTFEHVNCGVSARHRVRDSFLR